MNKQFYNIYNQFFTLPIIWNMYKNVLLNAEQISELKAAVDKILQQNMESFSNKITKNNSLRDTQHFDALYQFSEQQYSCFQQTLQNLAEFTFRILDNFDLVWDEVHHRQSKLLELRSSFSSATGYMEELKAENEDLKDRLHQAETYIQWIQQQKEYLDSIYYERDPTLNIYSNEKQLNKCVSERNLHWNENKRKKSINYEKLKVYIDNLKDDKHEMEKEILMLAKKYEVKSEECRKANLLAEHLVSRLNRRSEIKDYLETINNTDLRESSRTEIADDILKTLEKTDNTTLLSVKQHTNSLFDQSNFIQNKPYCHYFDSFTHLNDAPSRRDEDHNLSIAIPKETKEVKIGTDSFGKKAVACQTHSIDEDRQQPKDDLRISINISGPQNTKQRHDKIVKIIQSLNLEKEIESKLAPPELRHKEEKRDDSSDVRTADTAKPTGINNTLRSTYQYYHNRLVASRIKKYRFIKPDKANPKPCIAKASI